MSPRPILSDNKSRNPGLRSRVTNSFEDWQCSLIQLLALFCLCHIQGIQHVFPLSRGVISHISSFCVSVLFFPTLHFHFCFWGFCLSIPFSLLLTFCSILISVLPYFLFQTPLRAHPLVFLSIPLFCLHSYHWMPQYWYHKHLFILDHVSLTFLLIPLLFLTNPLVIFIPTICLSNALSI